MAAFADAHFVRLLCASLQLGDALSIASSFSPSVLAFMPAVFTAGVAAPLQEFLSQGTPRHQALAEDRETCNIILAEYTPDQPYRKTYLAFRSALQAEASAAAAWLHGGQQQEMLEKLRVLSEFKQRLEEQRWVKVERSMLDDCSACFFSHFGLIPEAVSTCPYGSKLKTSRSLVLCPCVCFIQAQRRAGTSA